MPLIKNAAFKAFIFLSTVEGLIALIVYFSSPSAEGNALWLGYSAQRLLIGFGGCLLLILFTLLSFKSLDNHWLEKNRQVMDGFLIQKRGLASVTGGLSFFVVAGSAVLMLIDSSRAFWLNNLVAILGNARPLVFWVVLVCAQTLLVFESNYFRRLRLEGWPEPKAWITIARIWAVLGLIFMMVFHIAAHLYKLHRFYDFSYWFIPLPVVVWIICWLHEQCSEKKWFNKVERLLTATAIFFAVLFVYRFTTLWVGDVGTPKTAYFHQLAEAFLHGQLNIDYPATFHDLTQFPYDGKWYVPFPPLPALLMVPWVALLGVDNMNTVTFSIIFGALNASLVFLMLEEMKQRGWSCLGRMDHLWLVLLFSLGSVHWWVAVVGKVWFISQICTVTFVALAGFLAINSGSPWLTGLALGLAMLARPNVGLVFPFLLGVMVQRMHDTKASFQWRRCLFWIMACSVPLLLSAGALLFYNHERFGNPTDFGYLTENVSPDLVGDLQTYGQFNPHFFERNLHVMLFSLPGWDKENGSWELSQTGMSLLVTTPALVYLLRSFRRKPFVIGAWLAIVLIALLLLMYYNTGYWQFGYRFSLDFMVPVMALLAIGAGRRVSWLMRGLILVGVWVNAIGVAWWFTL